MSAPKRVIISFLLGVFYYALMTVPWPGPWSGPAPILADAYASVFRAVANTAFIRIGNERRAAFTPETGNPKTDTTVRVEHVQTQQGGTMSISVFSTAYRKTAFFVALALATPFPWRRRLKVLLWGLLWVCLFVTLCVWLRMVTSLDAGVRIYGFGPFWLRVIALMDRIFILSAGTGYLVVAFIWMVTAFRRKDLDRLLSQTTDETAAPENEPPRTKPRPAPAGR